MCECPMWQQTHLVFSVDAEHLQKLLLTISVAELQPRMNFAKLVGGQTGEQSQRYI